MGYQKKVFRFELTYLNYLKYSIFFNKILLSLCIIRQVYKYSTFFCVYDMNILTVSSNGKISAYMYRMTKIGLSKQ